MYDITWLASDILGMLDVIGPAATKVVLLAYDKHDRGWRSAPHSSECGGQLFSPFLCGQNEDIRKEAGIETLQEFDTILCLLESYGFFSVLWDPRGHDHVLKFNARADEFLRQEHDEEIAKKESATQRRRSHETSEVLMAKKYAKKLNLRSQHPSQYCSSLRTNGEPCFKKPTGHDGVCAQHRTLLQRPRCTNINGAGIQCGNIQDHRDPEGLCSFHRNLAK